MLFDLVGEESDIQTESPGQPWRTAPQRRTDEGTQADNFDAEEWFGQKIDEVLDMMCQILERRFEQKCMRSPPGLENRLLDAVNGVSFEVGWSQTSIYYFRYDCLRWNGPKPQMYCYQCDRFRSN